MAPSLTLLALQGASLLALLLLGWFVATAEFAILGLPAMRRRQLLDEGHPRIGHVERILQRPRRLLVAVQVSKTVVRVGAAVLAALLALPYFGGWGAAAAAAGVTLVLVVFVDLLPRARAARNAERLALRVAPAFLTLEAAFAPLWWVFERISDRIFQLAGARASDAAAQFRSEEELKTLLAIGAPESLLEADEEEMIHSVMQLGDTTAREVMVPRIDITTVPGDAKLDHVKAFVLDSGFSRIPVYQGNVDNVVGILYVKDMLVHLVEKRDGREAHVRDLMREPYFVPESMPLADILKEMRERRVHVGIVVDEFGGTAGMLTLEDILEEIVGEIFDEYDLRHDPVKRLDARTAIVDARTHVADVNDALDIEIPEDEGFDTVAGFVQHQLGRLAREGEVVHGDGFDIVVEKITNRRILRARFVKHGAAGEGEKAEG
jgi:putative hemolysin